MASLGVASRLDEGQAAVDTVAEYVWACHLLGFDHPDLTRYRYQVRDWYAAEDGLDLRALDTECTALAAAATAAEQVLQLQDNQFQNLTQAWHGTGGRASTDFLGRHATSAAQVAAGIRGAAATLARLRDNLREAVDAKVSAALQIEQRRAGQRGIWLAAARTVSGGVGDRSAASELIDTQVKPFVANDIGGDWLTAMRSTTRAVADAYAQAVAALRAEAHPAFGIPGELGPVWLPTGASPGPAPALAADAADRSSAAGAIGGSTAAPASVPSFPAPATVLPAGTASGAAAGPEPILPAAAPVEPAAPASPAGPGQGLGGGGLPGLGGMPDIGSGLAGPGQQLADLFGGLLGSSAQSVPDDIGELPDDDVDDPDPEADETGEDANEGADDEDADTDAAEDTDGVDEIAGAEAGDPGADVVEETEPQSVPPETEPVPTVVDPLPPVPEPGPPAEPLAAPAGGTPCAIAADELPQVGE